ncbi:MAG: hypothetical protein ABH868_01880 [bacterium]
MRTKIYLLLLAALLCSFCMVGIALAEDNKEPSRFSLINRDRTIIFAQDGEKKPEDSRFFTKDFTPYSFDVRVWNKVSKEKDLEYRPPPVPTPDVSDLKLGMELPYQSSLSISGRKEIALKYETTKYDKPESERTESPKPETGTFDIEQKLQARIKGKVGRKITVNVDYDDTKFDKRDISVVYKGDPEEVVQEAAFGDIDLVLPTTEFVAYNKKLFGAKLDAKYKRLRLLAIGSRTQGISDSKEFKGRTTFQKKDIYDISYVKRKYYKLYFDSAHLPILNATEKIYIDDKDNSNNLDTTLRTVYDYANTVNYTGDFDTLDRGEDYTIDYTKGIITFNSPVGSNYVVAVAYEYSGGDVGYSNNIRMVKNEDETLVNRSLKNYYNLGATKILEEGFIVKIQDLSKDEATEIILYENNTDKSQFTSYQIEELDFDTGFLRFVSETPFPAEVYTTNPTQSKIIYVEYKHSVNTYRLGRIDILRGSEEIRVNGNKLERDVDYLIDYDIGMVTFLKEDIISEDSDVRIDFEYLPFGGQLQQTLVGARGELSLHRNWFVGSTIMYNWSAPPTYVPDVKGAPESVLVMEADSRYKFEKEGVPFKGEISGEIARSQRDVNTYGKAMIDNMEGSKTEDMMPTNKQLWLPASNPGQSADKRQDITLDNQDVDSEDINSNVLDKDAKQQVLTLGYSLPDTDSWASVVYPISKTGVDYSQKQYLELKMYGDGSNTEFNIDLGRISEDIDSDGVMDTEDANKNDELDSDEDNGLDLSLDQFGNNTSLPSNYGEDDGRLDTEDLDRDGNLDSEGFISRYSSLTDTAGTSYTSVSWTGWKTFQIPLDITAANKSSWENIKHVRLWMTRGTGTSASGSLKIAAINIVGNNWEDGEVTGSGSLDVRSINNEDDSGYVTLPDSFYNDIYNEDLDEDDVKEQALSLKYTLSNGEEGHTKKTFTSAQDYRDYKQLRFYVYGTNSLGGTVYFRIGTETAYFEFEKVVDWTGWKQINLNLIDKNSDFLADTIIYDDQELTKAGTPSLGNITELRFGVRNNTGAQITDGEIWVNDIHLADPQSRVGEAKRIHMSTSYKDWFSVDADFKTQDRNFETIGKKSAGQDSTRYSVDPRITYFKFLPIIAHWDKQKTITPTTTGTDLSSSAEGTVTSENKNIGADFRYKKWPHLNTKVSQSLQDIDQQQKKARSDSFAGSGDYDIPTNIFIFPKRFKTGYTRTNSYTNYGVFATGNENSLETIDDWNGELNFKQAWGKQMQLHSFAITPSYRLKRAELMKQMQAPERKLRNPRYTEQSAGVQTDFKFFGWFKPQANANVTSRSDYNTEASSYTVTSKNIRRDSIIDTKIPFAARDIISQSRFLRTLEIKPSYKLERKDQYEFVRSDFYILDKLWVDDKLKVDEDPKTTYAKDDFRTELRWQPLEFLELKKGWKPIGTVDTRIQYNTIEEHRTTTGTPSDTFTTIWPDLEFTFHNIEYFPLFYSFMQNARFTVWYSLKEIDRKKISLNETQNWRFKWNFKIFNKYTWIMEYQDTLSTDKNADGVYQKNNIVQKAGTQVNFNISKNVRCNLRYDENLSKQKGQSLSFARRKSPSITVVSDLRFPAGLRIPLLMRKPMYLRNALEISTALAVDMEESNVAKNNKNTYKADISADYDVSNNFVFTLGTSYSKVNYTQLPQNNYSTFNLLFKLLIKF